MSTHLILTVGTGTAGKMSDLSAGLVQAIDLIGPDAYWLIPSAHEDSRDLIAEEVRKRRPDLFRNWSETEAYACIQDHDNLEDARKIVGLVIQRALDEGATRVLVNPTSGTKQMTAGASLAALDSGLGELSFITGERKDGVVITGTEVITRWSAANWLAEKALNDAELLFKAGAYPQARTLLNRQERTPLAPELANRLDRCVRLCNLAEAWVGLDFAQAANYARELALDKFHARYATLAREARVEQPSLAVIAESLAIARHYRNKQDYELALHAYYRSLELGLDYAIWEATQVATPWPVEAIEDWELPEHLVDSLKHKAVRERIRAGMSDSLKVANELGLPLSTKLKADKRRIKNGIELRNSLSHSLNPMNGPTVDYFGDICQNILKDTLHLPQQLGIPDWNC